MLKLRSIDTIRKQHNFVIDLQSIPTVYWMGLEQKDYDASLKQTAKRLEVVDNNIETIIRGSDENIRYAVSDAKHLDSVVYVRELRFPRYLPQGKVQIQRDIISKLLAVAKGKKSIAKDLNQEMGECAFQGEWEANPRVGVLAIDDMETEMRLRNSLGLFSGYLNACEHEFYKQMINANLELILHYYHMLLQTSELRGEKAESVLMDNRDYFLNYSSLQDIADRIYYHRARDYLFECREMWSFLDGSEYTKRYLLRMEDVHPGLKETSVPRN